MPVQLHNVALRFCVITAFTCVCSVRTQAQAAQNNARASLPFAVKEVTGNLTVIESTVPEIQVGDVITWITTPNMRNSSVPVTSQAELEVAAFAKKDKYDRIFVWTERQGSPGAWILIKVTSSAAPSTLPFTVKSVEEGVQVLTYSGTDGELQPGDVITWLTSPNLRGSAVPVTSPANLEAAARSKKDRYGRVVVWRERRGSPGAWAFISVSVASVGPGKPLSPVDVKGPLKVAALFAIDSDLTTREAGAIKTTGEIAVSILDSHCSQQFRSIAKPTVLKMNRRRGIEPKNLLTEIAALKTAANDVVFVYACCHGGYSGNDHYLFLGKDEDDALTGLKRADVVAALKSKPHHAVVFLSDSCSTSLSKTPIALRRSQRMQPDDNLYRIFASLPKGTFLDINTARKGQFAAIDGSGGIATQALSLTLGETKQRSWDALQTAWQAKLTEMYGSLRGRTVGDPDTLADVKSKYEKQTDQQLDVRR